MNYHVRIWRNRLIFCFDKKLELDGGFERAEYTVYRDDLPPLVEDLFELEWTSNVRFGRYERVLEVEMDDDEFINPEMCDKRIIEIVDIVAYYLDPDEQLCLVEAKDITSNRFFVRPDD